MNENKTRRNKDTAESGNTDSRRSERKGFRNKSSRNSHSMATNGNRNCSPRVHDKDGKSSMKNDESWYLKNPELTQTATAFNLLRPSGVPFNLLDTRATEGSKAVKMNDTNLAGVCVFRYIPTIGYAASATDPVNVATTKIYAFVRHMNSGHTNYESADLMLYLLQMRQCYAWYMWMTRLYGILNSYSSLNRNLPKTLVAAMGVDYDDVIKNMPNLLFHINAYVSKLNALSVPSDMALYKRAAWMNVGVYFDADIIKAQTYLFQPYSYTIFNATSDPKGGHLEQVKLPTSGITFANIAQISSAILDPVFNDEDMNIMSGDILKAYGDKCLTASPVATDYVTYPTYVKEVSDQIHNIRILGEEPIDEDLDTWDIKQAGGVLRCQPVVYAKDKEDAHILVGAVKNLMDFPDNDISEGRTLEASRFMFSGYLTIPANEQVMPSFRLDSFGTEVIASSDIYYMENGVPAIATGVATVYNSASDMYAIPKLRAFTGAPIVFEGGNVSGTRLIMNNPEGELGNYVIVEPEVLYMLHQTALMSIFDL